MGNAVGIGGSRRVRLMKVDGETLKLKGPARVGDVLRDHPNHVVLDAQSVKTLGTLTRPFDDDHQLEAGKKKLYFLVEMPKLPPPAEPRRVRSGIHMGAKERLERLMLAKRSVSDLTFMKGPGLGSDDGVLRVKMRVSKSRVAELVKGSKDSTEAAQKIMDLCLKREELEADIAEETKSGNLAPWKPSLGSIHETASGKHPRQKRRFGGPQVVMVSVGAEPLEKRSRCTK